MTEDEEIAERIAEACAFEGELPVTNDLAGNPSKWALASIEQILIILEADRAKRVNANDGAVVIPPGSDPGLCPRCDVECIVSVAIKIPSGLILSLPAPARHHHVVHIMADLDIYKRDEARHEQGFVTSRGRFVDRDEAYKIASAAKQLIKHAGGKGLTSEHVW